MIYLLLETNKPMYIHRYDKYNEVDLECNLYTCWVEKPTIWKRDKHDGPLRTNDNKMCSIYDMHVWSW